MRVPKQLSHSSVSLYHKDPEEFYLRYLCPHRAPHTPQQNYMAIGSAFDAYAKSALHEALFGQGASDQFQFTAIFEEQVEPQNRDWALVEGKFVFDAYVTSGAYDDLLALLKQSKTQPRFEFTVKGEIQGDEFIVPFQGKPDCYFTHRLGFPVMLDWKVRGYCSAYAQSPSKFYQLVRDGWTSTTTKPSRGASKPHKLYLPYDYHGMQIHAGWLEQGSSDYADQLSAYTWLMGQRIGDVFLGCIDEIVCKPNKPRPLMRIAQHRARVSASHQIDLLSRIEACWRACTTGHVFTYLSQEENDERMASLDRTALGLLQNDEHASFFNEITRAGYR